MVFQMSAIACLAIGLIDMFVAEPGSLRHLQAGGLLLVIAPALAAAGHAAHLAVTRACRYCGVRQRKSVARCGRCSADIGRH